ncbi:MAG TPA: hypothetical protein VFO11_14085, partial [Candidatus Polarisedimenticolaceae bacterium]|nr:hypothetical protein [Candidatus Polarisedimenticolaceae bacterium]
WYSFTPTVSAAYRITTCADEATGTTLADSVLAVYTAGSCAGPFTQNQCNDDDSQCGASELESTLTMGMTAGTTYYIVAFSWSTTPPPSSAATVQLQVVRIPPPVNETCATATVLPLGFKVGSNASGLNDYTLSGAGCFTGLGQTSSTATGRDSVFSFTAPSAGSYSFKAQTFDLGGGGNLVLYTSPTCPGPGAISCAAPVRAANRNTLTANLASAEEILCQPMASGEQTFIFVDEAAAVANGGGYLVEATRCGQEVEANGTPATANALSACPMEGSITPLNDADFFNLGTPPAGTRVFAIADGAAASGNGDFDLRVTTATDTLEYDDEDNNDQGLNGVFGPNIQGRALTGVQSYLRVNHFNGQAEPYRLYSVLQPSSASATLEVNSPGNNTLTGAESAANGYFTGTFSSFNASTGEDFDAYKFCALEGDAITVGLDADPGRNLTPINAALYLYDELGTNLLSLNDGDVASSNTSGAGSLTAITPNSPGESYTWRARYSGAYYAATNPQASTNVPGGADYLLSVGLNCENTSAFTATLGTNLSAPATVNAGDTFDYTISISNSGPKTALEAEFVDTLPAGVTFVDINGTGTDSALCTQLPAVGGTGQVRCRVDCLRPGGSFDFIITVKTAQCVGSSTLNNTVNVTSKTPLQPGSVVTDSASVNVVDAGTCSDGLACTTGDHCQAGSCQPTGQIDCSDSDPCTLDQCDEATGCFNTFSEGEVCDDGNPCTQVDICLADPGGCVGLEPLGSPGEVTGVGFSNKTTLSWSSDATAFTYDAVRGSTSAFPVGPGGAEEVCFNNLNSNSTSDATLPGANAGFWYLVRGENTCAPAGSWGNATSGPRSTTTCP